MAQFTINALRFDPYKNFKFRVKWDGRYVAGISKVSALKRSTEVVEHREGGDPSTSRKSPGRTKYDPVTLERGVTHDTDFEVWANKIWNYGSLAGREVVARRLSQGCHPRRVQRGRPEGAILPAVSLLGASEFQALPDLDANANAVAIQTLRLETEGWERDYAVTEPAEPRFEEPA